MKMLAAALYLTTLMALSAFVFLAFGLIFFLPARLLSLTDRTLKDWTTFCFRGEWLDPPK